MGEEEPLFVGVMDPVDLRKDLLNSSRIIISSLKKFEMSRMLQEEKDAEISALRQVVKEIQMLNTRLKQIMPRTSVRVKRSVPSVSAAPRPRMMEIAKKADIVEEKTRLAELEDELASVEEKLQRME